MLQMRQESDRIASLAAKCLHPQARTSHNMPVNSHSRMLCRSTEVALLVSVGGGRCDNNLPTRLWLTGAASLHLLLVSYTLGQGGLERNLNPPTKLSQKTLCSSEYARASHTQPTSDMQALLVMDFIDIQAHLSFHSHIRIPVSRVLICNRLT